MRKIKSKRIDEKEIKKEVLENMDFHMLMYAVYKAAGLLLKKFKLHTQFGLNKHNENKIIDTKKIKVKTLEHYPVLQDFPYMKETIQTLTKSMLMLHNDFLKGKYELDGRIYSNPILYKNYEKEFLSIALPLQLKWNRNLKCSDKETEEALNYLADVITRFGVIEKYISKNIVIDTATRKYIRTMITKFNKYFFVEAKEIIESDIYNPERDKKIIQEFKEAGLIPDKKRRRG